MNPSKFSIPLFLCIVGTIGFSLLAIPFGYGTTMNLCFLPYAGLMFALSFWDRRVLGYAAVLSAGGPASGLANLSYSFILAVLAILKEHSKLRQVLRALIKSRWWCLFLIAFLFTGLSLPFWVADLRNMVSMVKKATSLLGYLTVLPVAVGLTLRTPRDGIRALLLLCMISAAFFAGFYFLGTVSSLSDAENASLIKDRDNVIKWIGQVWINFNRTQVCIPLAMLATGSLALAIGKGFNHRALPCYSVAGICLFLILWLASVGSFFAMLCGIVVLILCYYGDRLSPGKILLGGILFSILGSTIYWSVFETDNLLAERIKKKFEANEIDRLVRWKEGIEYIIVTPVSEGAAVMGHSDYMLFFINYNWLTGILYLLASPVLFFWMWHKCVRRISMNAASRKLLMVGLSCLTVYAVNSILDMLSANIGNYQLVWALILTPATVVAVTDAADHVAAKPNLGLSPLKPGSVL